MELVITGTGLVSSLGRDPLLAVTAIRAGLSRPAELVDYPVLDSETQELIAPTGHPVRAFTEGFHLSARWLRLAIGAFESLLRQTGFEEETSAEFWGKTAILLATPHVKGDRLQMQNADEKMMFDTMIPPMLAYLDLPLRKSRCATFPMSNSGAAHALVQATGLLDAQMADRVILIGVDSYLDGLSIEWLATHDRLKTPSRAVGFEPGEAAAAVLIETAEQAERRSAPIMAQIAGVGTAEEAMHIYQDAVNRGIGLSEAVAAAYQQTQWEEPFSGLLINDLNGEEWRAKELGSALLRLTDEVDPDAPLFVPAESLGDTGAAYGAIALAYAALALANGFAGSDHVCVISSTDLGDTGAIFLSMYEPIS
ncbi:hypothetical protein SCOR_06405 [Sulfidibacter corallicola]|uniref:3-oxoacyl-[acyl-carrier-protein] synthase-1 n=1 Tax=Sulfidibacter corallicola TaxID=2818388 RepID=A0A8A4TRH8_SULCO|nr:hypothetical protein [Sulfidibacter corallicola]QTD51601.1 hypothetical protein J3U87_03950 [Sulfidibacter corallicola]